MTYNVFGGTLNLAQSKPSQNRRYCCVKCYHNFTQRVLLLLCNNCISVMSECGQSDVGMVIRNYGPDAIVLV